MAGRKFQVCTVIGEYKLPSASVIMSLDSTGDQVLLASKNTLHIVDLSAPKIPFKYSRRNVKWEVTAAQWSPHKPTSSAFVITRNVVAELYNYAEGKIDQTSTLQSHTRTITDLDWSPFSSDRLLTCSADGYAFLWDTRRCSAPVQTFETPQCCSASQVKWNKLDEPIFATTHDRDIRIWDSRKTDRPVFISGHLKKIHGLDWSSHDSKILATASEDESVKFWNYSLNSPQHYNIGELKSRTHSPMWKARFAPFENSLVTIDVSQLRNKGDNCLMLWNIEDFKAPELQFTFMGHTDVVTEFQWRKSSPDNQYQLVTWSRDNTLRLCKYETSSSAKVIDINELTDRRSSTDSVRSDSMSIHRANSNVERRVRVPSMRGHVEETDEDDESSQDEITPGKGSGPRRESRSILSPLKLKLPPLSECAQSSEEDDDETLSHLCVDINEPTTAAAPLSPVVPVNILQNEFRSLSAIRNAHVRFEPNHRKAWVSITNIGEHIITLIMSFPDNYPEDNAPTFKFDSYTTIEKTLQGKLVIELQETANPLISNNKVCVEKCIYRLRNSIEELNNKNSLEMDVRRQSGHATTLQYQKNIPYPRTCGATFCNDRLVTFQRPVHPAPQSTPRSLNDGHVSHPSLNSRSRPNFYVAQMSRSPKDSMLSPFYKRPRSKAKKEKSGPVHIYNVSSLLPVNKNMAVEYRLDPSADTCRHNAEVAVKFGRRDLLQVWKVLEEFMDKRLDADPNNIEGSVPWAFLPLGRPMIKSMLKHYGAIGDFQTLSMIVSMFTYSSPQRLQPRPAMSSLTLQRSSSNVKISGTSPASSLTSRSPPDKGFSNIDSDSLSNGWPSTTTRWRADSHNGVMQDMRNPYMSDNETDMQQHKFYTTILDPNKGYLYDFYKTTYADQLYRWNLLDVRATLLKQVETEPSAPTMALKCGRCFMTYSGCSCSCKSTPNLCCALCRSGVRGSAILCLNCGHGGHLQHMRVWFSEDRECATGCGCHCLQYNTVEF